MRYYIEHLPMTIPMGVQSENNAEAVELDVSDWLARDGSLSFSVWVTRPGETEAYQAANATLKDGILYWWPTSADTAIAGEGRVEILAVSANRRMLSGWTATSIRETTTETTTDAPVDQRPWLDQALLARDEAKAAAASAAASADQAEGVVKKEIATLTEDIARDTAPAIIPTATGEVVTVSDSAHRPLAGLRLYGKTTQNGTPTPNSPVPLVSVGADGSIGTTARGKNLIPNVNSVTNGTVIFTANADGSFTVNGTADGYRHTRGSRVDAAPFRGKSLTLSGGYTFANGFVLQVYLICESGDVYQSIKTGASITFVMPQDATAMELQCYATDGYAANNIKIYPQLEVGTSATAFEPYKDGGSVTASTPNGLPGIKVSSDGNYTDENGQQWVCDEIDFERGVYVRRVKKIVLNGSEAWANGYVSDGVNNRFETTIPDAYLYSARLGYAFPALCNAFTNRMVSSIPTVNSFRAVRGSLDTTTGFLLFNPSTSIIPLENLTAWKTWLATNPITVFCPLGTPIETPMSTSELAEFRAMTSQKPNTTVYNDAGAGLGVDYIADTRNYIDQRISALLNA